MRILKKFKEIVLKYKVTVWMFIAIFAITGLTAYAKYNDNRNVVKRVVATQKGDKVLFSSNLLSTSITQQIKTVENNALSEQYYDIYIYDYDIKNPGSEYPVDISYDLIVSFYDSAGSTLLTSEQINSLIGTDSVRLHNISGSTVSLDSFLTVDKDTTLVDRTVSRTVTKSTKVDSFRLYMPISMKEKNISVKILAEPSGYTDLPERIGANFIIKAQTFIAINGWHGGFNDDTSISLSQYDGFNYSITGNGTSEGVLSWNNSLLEPNMQQIDEIKKEGTTVTSSGTTSSVTVSLNSANNGGRYDIQFYVVSASGRSSIDSMSWTDFSNSTTGAVTFLETAV